MKRIAVFASGNGSNFQFLVDAEKNEELAGEISLLISDKENAFVNDRAKKADIPNFYFNPKAYENKDAYESIIVDILNENKIDLVVLAGYMRLVGPTLLKAYKNKIINLHPSLLPSFQGKDAIGQALDYGAKYTGVTVHFVDDGMDTGPIIKQKVIEIDIDDTAETLAEKIHQVEHHLLLNVVNIVIRDCITINDRKVLIKGE